MPATPRTTILAYWPDLRGSVSHAIPLEFRARTGCPCIFFVTDYDKCMATRQPPQRPRGRPPTGKAIAPAERMRRLRARRKAEGLKAVTRWVSSQAGPFSTHRLADVRSLAIHAVLAAQAVQDPSLLVRAEALLDRWASRQGTRPEEWLLEWRRLLRRPLPAILTAMTALSEEGARLRQSSPFAPLLDAAHRRRIHEALRP